MRRLLRKVLYRAIDVDAIGMGCLYVLAAVVLVLAAVYAWKRWLP